MKAGISLIIVSALLAALRPAVQPAGAQPADVVNVEKRWGGASDLMPLARADQPAVRDAAVRALGRLEDPRLVLDILSLERITDAARADAVAQSLKGFDAAVDPRLVQAALEWLSSIGARPLTQRPDSAGALAVVMMPLGRIAYATPEQMRQAERIVRRITLFARADPQLSGIYLTGIRALESLARVNAKTAGLEKETVALLEQVVARQSPNDSPESRRLALAALINGRGLVAATTKLALRDDDWQVRRQAMTVLAGGASGFADTTRIESIAAGLDDTSANVRYEAVRAYTRAARASHCEPILARVNDRDPHVSVAAIDALGDLCKDDEDVTTRVLATARRPPAAGPWHREAHAIVALARRSPGKAATAIAPFATHPLWWVRMYAARAAAAANDRAHLQRLAGDTHDNVVEAALGPLRRLMGVDAEPAIVAALDRTDVQLLRTAAGLLKESRRNPPLTRPLAAALMRLTKEGKDTSRDSRLALLDAIAVHTTRENAAELEPLLRDFDPRVAERAAQIMTERTGRSAMPAAIPPVRGWPQAFTDLRQCVVVDLASGDAFRMTMQPAVAPIAVDRFLKLATRDHYYDGLTIHRVDPNFVVQGGSPGANEYAGHKDYMRDEVGGDNTRGTVGLSTRGRNTGDAQFFINLIDNPRLNYDYTVFATVMAEDMNVVDRIQEGDVMRTVRLGKCAR